MKQATRAIQSAPEEKLHSEKKRLVVLLLFELLVPTAFVFDVFAKGLVPDEKNHDVLYRSFSIGAGWNPTGNLGRQKKMGVVILSSLKGSGWQFTFTPITEETSDIVERATEFFVRR